MKTTTLKISTFMAFVAVSQICAEGREQGAKRDTSNVTGVVLHSIGGPACVDGKIRYQKVPERDDDAEFWRNYLAQSNKVDIHYIIGRSGNIESLIDENQIAFHAGIYNSNTIGIELVNTGDGIEKFPENQISALIILLRDIRRRNTQIALENIVTHSMIDQRTCNCGGKLYRRRPDPGAAFPYAEIIKSLLDDEDSQTQLVTDFTPITGPAKSMLCDNKNN